MRLSFLHALRPYPIRVVCSCWSDAAHGCSNLDAAAESSSPSMICMVSLSLKETYISPLSGRWMMRGTEPLGHLWSASRHHASHLITFHRLHETHTPGIPAISGSPCPFAWMDPVLRAVRYPKAWRAFAASRSKSAPLMRFRLPVCFAMCILRVP